VDWISDRVDGLSLGVVVGCLGMGECFDDSAE